MNDGRRRAVVTGVGVVAPGGTSRDKFWQLLIDGRTATRRVTAFDPAGFRSQIAAECGVTRPTPSTATSAPGQHDCVPTLRTGHGLRLVTASLTAVGVGRAAPTDQRQ